MSSFDERQAEDLLGSYKKKFKATKQEDAAIQLTKTSIKMQKLLQELQSTGKAASNKGTQTKSKSNGLNDEAIKKQSELLARFVKTSEDKNQNDKRKEEKSFEADAIQREGVAQLKEIVKLLKVIAKEDAPSLLNGLFGNRRGGGLSSLLGDRSGKVGNFFNKASSVEGYGAQLEKEAKIFEKPGMVSRIGSFFGNKTTNVLNKLGPLGTGLRFGSRGVGKLGSLAAKGFGAIEGAVPGLGLLLGGAQEIGTLNDLSGKRGTSFFGDKNTGGIVGSRAAGYGSSALNGAMAGASVGTFLGGPLGTAIGGGIGALGGIGTALYTDFKPQIDKFAKSMIEGGKNLITKSWKGLTDISKNAYKFVVDHIPSWSKIKNLAEGAIAGLSISSIISAVSGVISDIYDWIKSKIPSIDDIKKGALNIGSKVVSGVGSVASATGDAIMHPVRTAKAVGSAISSGASYAGHAAITGAKAVGGALMHPITALQNLGKGAGNLVNQGKEALMSAMDAFGITDPKQRAGIAAVVQGESGFKPRAESDYSHTSSTRLKNIFKSSLGKMSDADIDKLKSDPKAFFDKVYAHSAGNKGGDDGYNFRGRGDIQLTGRANYEKYGKMIGVDLIKNPELANDPKVAAALAVAYAKDRNKTGDFAGLKKAVNPGASADLNSGKDAAYNKFLASGEFSKTNKATMMADNQAAGSNPAGISGNTKPVNGISAPPTVNMPQPAAPSQTAANTPTTKNTQMASNTPAAAPSSKYSGGNSNDTDIDSIPMLVPDNALLITNSGLNA